MTIAIITASRRLMSLRRAARARCSRKPATASSIEVSGAPGARVAGFSNLFISPRRRGETRQARFDIARQSRAYHTLQRYRRAPLLALPTISCPQAISPLSAHRLMPVSRDASRITPCHDLCLCGAARYLRLV